MGFKILTQCSDGCSFGGTVTEPVQYIRLFVQDLNFSPKVVVALPAGALGWDDTHYLQQDDGGHHDEHILGGKKGFKLVPEVFAAQ